MVDADKAADGKARPPLPPQRRVQRSAANTRGSYVKYKVQGNVFELTSKYKPPIMSIGRGAYGSVCSVVNSETNEKVAVKKIFNAFANPSDAKRTLREIKLLLHMDHENIISIRDLIPPPRREFFNDVYIVYELMDTDLHKIISSGQPLVEQHCQYILYQLLRGLKYMHSANVLHRDLKPSNLLLSNNCELKICDFGLARVIPETHFMTGHVVTRWYRAPELLLNSSDYTSAIDMWSVGCIFMEMVTGKPLLQGGDRVHQLRLAIELIGTPSEAELSFLSDKAKLFVKSLPRCRKQSIAEKLPQVHWPAADLVEKMLAFDPRKRITVENALAHSYLRELHDIADEPVCSNRFGLDFERDGLTVDEIKEMVYQECLAFYPEMKN